MNDTDAFLDVLGVDAAADAHAIRRAYANKLEQVDPARDPAGFQALHDAYREALDWAARQGQETQETQETAQAGAMLPRYDRQANRSKMATAARWLVHIAIVAVAFKSLHFLYDRQSTRSAAGAGQQHSRADDRKARRNPPTEEQLAVHLPPFTYESPPGAEPGYYKLTYDVVLDAEGKVVETRKRLGNPLPGFEAAAEAALRAAKPFPASTARIFTISLIIDVTTHKAAPRKPPLTRSI